MNYKQKTTQHKMYPTNYMLFTILSCTDGLGPQATTSLASLLSAKWNQAYSLTIMWWRCRLAYSLLRSSVMCIRGARSHLGHYMSATQPPLDLPGVKRSPSTFTINLYVLFPLVFLIYMVFKNKNSTVTCLVNNYCAMNS